MNQKSAKWLVLIAVGIFWIAGSSNRVFADTVKNVNLVTATPGKDNLELKFSAQIRGKTTEFSVDVIRSDPDAFEKLVTIMQKMTEGDRFTLDLNIVSFSPFPIGSYYRSNDVKFSGKFRASKK